MRAGLGYKNMNQREKYFNYKPMFNRVFSGDNLPWIKDGAYAKRLDGKPRKGTPLILWFIDKNKVVYFNFFGIEYILQEILNKMKDKAITRSTLKIKSDDSVMCEFIASLSKNIWLQEKLC